MKDNKVDINRTSLTMLDLLAVAFIVLKLCKVINWSWWIVLSPIWGAIILTLIVATILYVLYKKDII